MEKKIYTFETLLDDPYFVSSVHRPTRESETFWRTLVERGQLDRDEYELARHYVQNIKKTTATLTQEEVSDMWMHITTKNQQNQRNNQRNFYFFLSIAASALLALGLFFFYAPDNKQAPLLTDVWLEQIPEAKMNGDDILLVLSEKHHVAVKENNTEITYNDKGEAKIHSEQVEQKVVQPESEETIKYNQVMVPKGRHSSLTLSDGTKIWLNAYSRIVYPPVFEKDKRTIYLEGEAYLEVAPDNNRPFIVQTSQMNIKVLGTAFNVTAYQEEAMQSVVLVAGAVAVKIPSNQEQPEKETTLSPNQQLIWSDNKLQTKHVDAEKHVSWKDGYLLFESSELAHICKRVANYYGITIEYDEAVGNMRYTGKLDLKESPERVLNGLQKTAAIQFEKKNDIYRLKVKP